MRTLFIALLLSSQAFASGGSTSNSTALQGTNVSTTSPTSNQCLVYSGSLWAPASCSAGGGITGSWSSTGNVVTTNGSGAAQDGGTALSALLTSATAASTYLSQSSAASTYAPLASPTFTGTATIPTLSLTNPLSGSSVSGGTFGAVNGSALTNLTGANVIGTVPSATSSANTTATSNATLVTLSNLSLPYSQLTGTPTLGTAAALNVGTSANNVVQLTSGDKLPAVDGSLLTNLPSGGVTGPVSSTVGHLAVFNNTTGSLLADSGTAFAAVVTGPASSTANALASYSNTSGNAVVSAPSYLDPTYGSVNFGETSAFPTTMGSANVNLCANDACFVGGTGANQSEWLLNVYYDRTGYKHKTTGAGAGIVLTTSGFNFYTVASGTAGTSAGLSNQYGVSSTGAVTGGGYSGGAIAGTTGTFTGNVLVEGGIAIAGGLSNSATISTSATTGFIPTKYSATGTVAITLHAASTCSLNQKIEILDVGNNAGTNAITISTQGSDTLTGSYISSLTAGVPNITAANAASSVTINNNGGHITLWCSGYTANKWYVSP